MLRRLLFRPALLIGLAVVVAGVVSPAHARRASDCAAEADRAARDRGTMVGGAARGAVRGAIVGSIIGGNGKDRRRGAAIGAIVGTARTARRKNDVYERVYDDCMAGRRYRY